MIRGLTEQKYLNRHYAARYDLIVLRDKNNALKNH